MPPNVGCPCGIEPKVGLVDSPNEGVGDDVLAEPMGALAGASTGGEDSDCGGSEGGLGAVSYTHLTLPTICSV